MESSHSLTAPWGAREMLSEAVSPVMGRIGLMLMAAVVLVNDSNFSNSDADATGLDSQTLLKLAICGACGLYGLLNLERIKHLPLKPGAIWLTLFAGWALLCAPLAVNPTYSFMALGLLVCMALFAPALLQTVGPKKILMTAVILLEFYLLACWVSHLIAPEINGFDPDTARAADVARLGGLSHPNSTANKATLAIALMLSLLSYRWVSFKRLLLPLAFTLITLLMTGSRTWTGASLCVMALAGWRELHLKSKALLICGTVALGGFLGLILVNEMDNNSIENALAGFSRSGKSEEIYSMTGRAELWEVCEEKIAESPLWGCGYGCQRFVLQDHYWVTRHAHNLILNTTLGCGFVGAALLVLLLCSQSLRALFSDEFFPAAILLMLFIGGLAENPIFNPMPGVILLFFLICLSGTFSKAQLAAESVPLDTQRSDA